MRKEFIIMMDYKLLIDIYSQKAFDFVSKRNQ